jgi:site-specific DNA recombinase
MRVALYARYSDDKQRDASIADQFRICRLHVEQEGWRIIEEYSDHAISGASLLRPGIQALMADALAARFDLVLAEAMDRLSRDQEDIAGFHKRMAYAGVKVVTLSEGEVTHLHVGLKGTMNALFLKDLADKTRRGLRGRVEKGRSGGGNSYGYDVVRALQTSGEVDRGGRTINCAEADVVRRIFRDYAAGKSPKKIAMELNREKMPGPSGGAWGFSTLNGNAKRGNGVLNNELYIGRLTWNRQRFIKDPDTGRRRARPNPPSEWIVHDVPELAIVDQALWDAVKARQAQVMRPRGETVRLDERRRPRFLLSGIVKCGCCGGGYSMISSELMGCSTARNKGICDNRANIRRDVLETRVLTALKSRLMDPPLFAEFCEEFTRELNRVRMEGQAGLEAMKALRARVDRQLDRAVQAILDGVPGAKMKDKIAALEARKVELDQALETAEEPPPLLHPEMAGAYRREVAALHEALHGASEADRALAGEAIRQLVEAIVLTPDEEGLEIDVRGDLAGILSIATQRKPPALWGAGGSQVKVGAGTGFEPVTFRL